MNWEPRLREQIQRMVGTQTPEGEQVQVIPIPRDLDVRNRISMAYALVRQVIDASMEELTEMDSISTGDGASKEDAKQWFLVGVPAKSRRMRVEAHPVTEAVPQKNEFLARMETLISGKRFLEAERELQEKLETGVIHPSLIYLLSSVQVHLGKKAEARENLALLLRLKPDHERGRALAKKLET